MQIYKGIPIISAAPSAEDKEKVEHRLFEIYDCNKRGNVVEWLDLCVSEIKMLWQKGLVPVVVGGTGMYIYSLLNGISPIPNVSASTRETVEKMYYDKGLSEVYEYLKSIDQQSAQKLALNDKSRIMRAVEIYLETGKKMSDWHKVPMVQKLPEANFFVVELFPDIKEIELRCQKRLDKMVGELGVLEEISDLLKQKISDDMPAMKALGVPELGKYIKGEVDLKDAIQLAKLHTRQYVKRQRTWLRGKIKPDLQFDTVYVGQDDFVQSILRCLNKVLNKN